jgi:hypothetical protein
MTPADAPSGSGATGDANDPRRHLSPAAMTALLREAGHDVSVAEVRSEPVGTGQMGESYRLHLTYQGDPGELPPTLVGKVAGGPPQKRAVAAGSYRTEVTFYRRLAPTVTVRAPRCWASWVADDATDFVLLLEDLAPRVQGDQIRGCTIEEATSAAVTLAGLHGPRWCDPTLVTQAGLAVVDEEQASLVVNVLEPMTEVFVQRYGDRLAPEDVEVMRRVPAVAGAWLRGRSERFGPVHGDYRLDNLLFAPEGDDVATVDWQTVSLGLPARDVAFLCATGLQPEVRQAGEDEVVAAYHRALVATGVEGYDLAQCRDDYRYAMLQAPLIEVLGSSVADVTERGDDMFLAMTRRSCAAIRDLDTFALI